MSAIACNLQPMTHDIQRNVQNVARNMQRCGCPRGEATHRLQPAVPTDELMSHCRLTKAYLSLARRGCPFVDWLTQA